VGLPSFGRFQYISWNICEAGRTAIMHVDKGPTVLDVALIWKKVNNNFNQFVSDINNNERCTECPKKKGKMIC
jgi:hypothetical protein